MAASAGGQPFCARAVQVPLWLTLACRCWASFKEPWGRLPSLLRSRLPKRYIRSSRFRLTERMHNVTERSPFAYNATWQLSLAFRPHPGEGGWVRESERVGSPQQDDRGPGEYDSVDDISPRGPIVGGAYACPLASHDTGLALTGISRASPANLAIRFLRLPVILHRASPCATARWRPGQMNPDGVVASLPMARMFT